MLLKEENGEIIAKISDFGLSRSGQYYYQSENKEKKIPIKWTPKVKSISFMKAFIIVFFNTEKEGFGERPKFSVCSDIWSFGIYLNDYL